MGSQIKLCDAAGQCEDILMAENFPARLCVADSERPARWFWPFTQVRLRLELDMASRRSSQSSWIPGRGAAPAPPVVRTKVASRGFCRWFGPATASLCQDCETVPCPERLSSIWGTRDYALYLPPYGGCVHVQKLPEGVTRARATWERPWDPLVCLKVAVGLCLVWYWLPIRESVAVHASIGGVGSLVFVFGVVLIWIVRELRGTLQGAVPFGRSLSALSTLLLAFVPAARDALIGLVVPDGSWDWRAWVTMRDPFFHLPVGAIASAATALLAVGTVTMGANISMRHFATPPDPEGDVPFLIGADGRRVDLLPPAPLSQRCLGWIFWFLGIMVLLFSSHSDVASLLLVTYALSQEHLVHLVRQRLLELEPRCAPGSLRPLVSTAAFLDEGRRTTAAALNQLQDTIRARPDYVLSVREDTELRLRRFSDGGSHFVPPKFFQHEDHGRCFVL